MLVKCLFTEILIRNNQLLAKDTKEHLDNYNIVRVSKWHITLASVAER